MLPAMDPKTVDIYETKAAAWVSQKQRPVPVSLEPFVARTPPGVRGDLGSGPGWHSAQLGAPVVALDAAYAMLRRVPDFAPDAWRVQGDLERLPFRRGALSGAWAHKAYMHVPAERVPMALAELHHAVALGGAVHLQVTCDQLPVEGRDPFAGRHFTHFTTAQFREIVESAGFDVLTSADDGEEWIDVEATRALMLPDTVGPAMRVLIVGLNPSILSAEKGFGFARPGNRFWPAAIASGLVSRARDPYHALIGDGVGMTNLVRRPTRGADELTRDEYRAGAARLERLCAWLRPGSVCFLGVTGYRAAIDPKAQLGWQPQSFGTTPVYVMPNPSGLNAHAKPADFVEHFRIVQRGPDAA
jgi:double-stranded uracil-DNA glycosylase